MMSASKIQYPRARLAARRLKQSVMQAIGQQTSSPTLIATVADTSAQLAQGFVNATTNQGPIQVSGVPLYSVCPGTQIYVRQLGGKAAYIYDGLAGNYTNRLTSSGSVISTTGQSAVAATSAVFGSTISNVSLLHLQNFAHFFLSFFFSVASVPPPGEHITLVDLAGVGGSSTGNTVQSSLQVVYLNSGQLDVYLTNWPTTYSPGNPTDEYFAPRSTWFVTIELGLGMQVNGIQTTSMQNITSIIANTAPPSGYYGMFLLGDHLGGNAAPAGSWVSKVMLGYMNTAAVFPFSATPQSDAEFTAQVGTALLDYGLWYCDSPGATTLPASSLTNNIPLTVLGAGASTDTGPY